MKKKPFYSWSSETVSMTGGLVMPTAWRPPPNYSEDISIPLDASRSGGRRWQRDKEPWRRTRARELKTWPQQTATTSQADPNRQALQHKLTSSDHSYTTRWQTSRATLPAQDAILERTCMRAAHLCACASVRACGDPAVRFFIVQHISLQAQNHIWMNGHTHKSKRIPVNGNVVYHVQGRQPTSFAVTTYSDKSGPHLW